MTSDTKNKTQPTNNPVNAFLAGIQDPEQKRDAEYLCELMTKITGRAPIMWGPSIIGFDQYHYKYESGREGDMAAIDFSPRKSNLTIYLADGVNKYSMLLDKLGPHKVGKGCLYIKHISDVDTHVLEELLKSSYQYVMSRKDDMHRAE